MQPTQIEDFQNTDEMLIIILLSQYIQHSIFGLLHILMRMAKADAII